MGDFEFAEIVTLPAFDFNMFWIVWLVVVLMTCIVFLNFIIAEVSASYQTVKDKVRGLIDKERAQMIKETEDIMLQSWKDNKELFPKYLISR